MDDVEKLIQNLKSDNDRVVVKSIEALRCIGESAIPALIKALREDIDYRVRYHSAESLGKIGDISAVSTLVEALGDKNEYVRMYAASALGDIGDPSAVTALIEVLKDTYEDVRIDAASALGDIGDPSAVPALIEALKNKNSGVQFESDSKFNAASALGDIGDPSAVPALIEALKNNDEDWNDRFIVAEALVKIGDISAVPSFLIEGLEYVAMQQSAIEMLVKIGKPAVPALVDALKFKGYGPKFRILSNAAKALVKIGDISYVSAIVKAFGNLPRRYVAVEILEEMLNKCETIEALECFEKNMMEGISVLRSKCKCNDDMVELTIEYAKLMKEVSEKKNQLASKRDILLKDRPKPPKRGKMYQRMRVRSG